MQSDAALGVTELELVHKVLPYRNMTADTFKGNPHLCLQANFIESYDCPASSLVISGHPSPHQEETCLLRHGWSLQFEQSSGINPSSRDSIIHDIIGDGQNRRLRN